MPLLLKEVEPQRGARWVHDAWRLYLRRPFAFTLLLMVFFFLALLLPALLALVGLGLVAQVLQFAIVPMLSLGFMVASQSALLEGRVHAGQFIEPFTAHPGRRRSLLLLCLLYGLLALGIMMLGNAVSHGGLAKLVAVPGPTPEELSALLADTSVTSAVLLCSALITLLTIPFWHAPALVHWGEQGVGQALFSSTLAVWRAKGAFLVYGLSWLMLLLGSSIVLAIGVALLQIGALMVLLSLAAGLLLTTLFYVSLIFTFNDSFGNSAQQLRAAADPAP